MLVYKHMLNKNKYYLVLNRPNNKAFTIVELLVVIVVIGILAAITIVSYSGITKRASVSSLMSDLKNASTQLAMDYVLNGDIYPVSGSLANGGKGLSKSPTTTFKYVSATTSYCVTGTLINYPDVSYYYSSTDGVVKAGECPDQLPEIVTAGSHACALSVSGNYYCFGDGTEGGLGQGVSSSSLTPVAVSTGGFLSGLTIKSLSSSGAHSCVIASDNNAYCWGRNNSGQLGDNSITNRNYPVAVVSNGALNGLTIKSIAAGYDHTCVIASDNNAYCWGRGNEGQLGRGSGAESRVPVAVNKSGLLNGLTIKSIATGGNHSCVIASDDNAYCWGANTLGQLGVNNIVNQMNPQPVYKAGALGSQTIASIYAGGNFNCALTIQDNYYCWGENSSGQIGDGTSGTNRIVPTGFIMNGALNGLTIKSMSLGSSHVCVLASDNNAYCWGYNFYGQIGKNTSGVGSDSTSPTAVIRTGQLNGLTVKKIYAGAQQSCVLASNDKLYCWGQNSSGQVGDGTSGTNRLTPVAVQAIP